VTRIRAFREAVAENPNADLFILERSIFTDRFVFMELQRKMVGVMLMTMYEEMWRMWSQLMPYPIDHAVFLKPTIQACQSRVASRARAGEVAEKDCDDTGKGGVSDAYQARLCQAHDDYFAGKFGDRAPFEKMVVVEGELADGDFRKPSSPGTPRIVNHVLDRVLD
jgi:deoxyadenosine/deoxycytidine kinase